MTIEFGFTDFIMILPMLVIFFTSLVPLTVKMFKNNYEQKAAATLLQAVTGLFVGIILAITMYGGDPAPVAFGRSLIFDGITVWLSILVLITVGVVIFLIYENVALRGGNLSEVVFLVLGATVGMLIIVAANDLITIFIGLETMSLPLYLLIAMSREGFLAKEAALKYFVLGSLASAIFLYGVSFIFGTAGSTNFMDIFNIAKNLIGFDRLFLVGCILVIVGLCFKVSIVPFHAWTPDVYQGAPTPITALMATAVKAVGIIAFVRLVLTQILFGSEALLNVMQWLAVLTMIVGNVGALLQDNLKRMFAYSSIAHSGYLLIGIITVGISEKLVMGASSVVLYLIAYIVMTLGGFAIVCIFEERADLQLNLNNIQGLARRHPWLAASLTIVLLSLAGIPPTIGFFAKFYLLIAAVSEGLLWLAIWGVINSVIAAYYYLKPIVYMYMQDGESFIPLSNVPATRFTIILTSVLVVGLGLFVGLIL